MDNSSVLQLLQIVYDPQSSSVNRIEAHRGLEMFEEKFSEMPLVSYQLADSSNPLQLRHFGLHLMENFIRYKWTSCQQPLRMEIRQNLLQFIQSRCLDILNENTLIKEALARCLVEIIKSEWPQRWPTFFSDCKTVLTSGFCQCQIILIAWNRLIEDVIIIQNVENNSRRRDLHNCLVTNGGQLFSVGADVLNETYSNLLRIDDESQIRLCSTTLEFLSNCFDWIQFVDSKSHSDLVLNTLCRLLSDKRIELKKFAVQCLIQAASRKSEKKGDFPFVLTLLNEINMQLIVSAVKIAASQGLGDDEYNYLKSLSSFLNTFGLNLSQVCVFSTISDEQTKGFDIYLNAIFAILQHPSLILRCHAVYVFNSFLKNVEILNSRLLATNSLQKFVLLIPVVIQLQGSPSKYESPYSDYSRLDFDSDLGFLQEFGKFRECCMAIVQRSVLVDYTIAHDIIYEWITKSLNNVENLHNLSPLSWDAMIRVTTRVVQTLSKKEFFDSEKIRSDSKIMLEIVYSMIDFDKFQLSIVDLALSTWSSFFPLLSLHPTFILPFVSSLFRIALMNDESEVGRKIRHHAMHNFVHLAVEHPKLLSPFMSEIIVEMEKYATVLTLRQKCSLAEGLIVLGNEFCNFERQKSLVELLINASVKYFSSPEITECFSSPNKFAQYIGLFDVAPEIISNEDLFFGRKKEIGTNLLMLNGVFSRLVVPKDLEVLKSGGYVDESTSKIIHPMFSSLQTIFVQLFSLARCLNGLYSSSVVKNIHPSYGSMQVLDLTDTEKHFNLDAFITSQSQEKIVERPTEQMKLFIAETTEKIQILLGLVIAKFNWQFYRLDQTKFYLTQGVLSFLDDVLDQRLRFWIRRFFTPLVEDLPADYVETAAPALTVLINHCFHRLSSRWQLILARLEQNEDVDLTRQETFLEDSTRLLTRDYINFLSLLVRRRQSGRRSLISASKQNDDDDENELNIEMDDNDDDQEQKNGFTSSFKSQINDIAVALLNPQSECLGSLTLSIFNSLTWLDTNAAKKSCFIAPIMIDQLLTTKSLDETTSNHLFCCILNSIQLHGQHDSILPALLMLGCDLYEVLAAEFQQISTTMLEIPECTEKKLNAFNKKLSDAKSRNEILPEKLRRDEFRQLIKGIIGTNVGQKFRRKTNFKNDLSPLLLSKRFKPIIELDGELGICNLFGVRNN